MRVNEADNHFVVVVRRKAKVRVEPPRRWLVRKEQAAAPIWLEQTGRDLWHIRGRAPKSTDRNSVQARNHDLRFRSCAMALRHTIRQGPDRALEDRPADAKALTN